MPNTLTNPLLELANQMMENTDFEDTIKSEGTSQKKCFHAFTTIKDDNGRKIIQGIVPALAIGTWRSTKIVFMVLLALFILVTTTMATIVIVCTFIKNKNTIDLIIATFSTTETVLFLFTIFLIMKEKPNSKTQATSQKSDILLSLLTIAAALIGVINRSLSLPKVFTAALACILFTYLLWQKYIFYIAVTIPAAIIPAVIISAAIYFLNKKYAIKTDKSLNTGKIVHISDLHFVENDNTKTMEKEENSDLIGNKKINEEIKKITTGETLIITGDITDRGKRLEWSNFLKSISGTNHKNIIITPGNHDLNFTPPTDSILSMETNNLVLRKIRKLRFIKSAIAANEKLKYIDKEGKLKNVKEKIHNEKEKINKYINHGMIDTEQDTKTSFVDDLWDELFPLTILSKENNEIFIVFDSNRTSTSIFTTAFGFISEQQIRKIKTISKIVESEKIQHIYIALHHHIRVPSDVKYGQSIPGIFQKRFLELINSDEFIFAITKSLGTITQNISILHGHKHLKYSTKIQDIEIHSAQSLRFGNMAKS